MVHDYTPLEIKLTTPGQRVFYVYARCSVAEVDGQEMLRHSLRVPVSLLSEEWGVNEDEHDRVYVHDLQTWILTSVFDGGMVFDTFPLDGRFYFEIVNPDDLMKPNPVGIYEIGQYSVVADGTKQLLLCTTKESVRNLICRFYPKFFCHYTFASDSWDPRVMSDHRSAFDTILTAAMLYATAFSFNGDMDEDLSVQEWAIRTTPHLPWASVEACNEWVHDAMAHHHDALIFDVKSPKIRSEFNKLLQEEHRMLALRQVRRVATQDVLQALPLVETGTEIHEEDHLVSLQNGVTRATGIWGTHYNFKGDPVRTLLAFRLPAEDGQTLLYLGEHIQSLLINLDLKHDENETDTLLQKGRL